MTLAERMKQIRVEKSLTQKEVASLMGISQQAYGQYESGTREPKNETLGRIATALGISKYDLLRPVMENDKDFIDSNWFAEMSDEDILYAMIPPPDDAKRERKSIIRQKELLDGITSDFAFLNDEGQEEAAKRVQELTQIPKYQRPTEIPPDAPGGTGDKEPAEK